MESLAEAQRLNGVHDAAQRAESDEGVSSRFPGYDAVEPCLKNLRRSWRRTRKYYPQNEIRVALGGWRSWGDLFVGKIADNRDDSGSGDRITGSLDPTR